VNGEASPLIAAGTPDEWLLARYEATGEPHGNHVRPIFELLYDWPAGSTEVFARMSGDARWPVPHMHHELDNQLELIAAHRTRRSA
jgi:hypothetical protein